MRLFASQVVYGSIKSIVAQKYAVLGNSTPNIDGCGMHNLLFLLTSTIAQSSFQRQQLAAGAVACSIQHFVSM